VRRLPVLQERHTNLALAVVYLALAVEQLRNAIRFDLPLAGVYFAVHLVTAVLFLVRHETIRRSPHWPGYLAAVLATFYVYLYDFTTAAGLALERLGAGLMLVGAVGTLLAVLSLGRCFGILPVYRGVTTRGMYRLVRHPIYASYLVMDTGIVLSFTSARNVALFLAAILLFLTRVHYEEMVLREDEAYEAYTRVVRYRLVPPVY